MIRDFFWKAGDETRFPAKSWGNPERAAFVLVGVHGMGGAPSDFDSLANAVADQGGFFVANTVRGQGGDPDPRRRGHEMKPSAILQDLREFIADTTPTGLPLILIGESLGALLLAKGLSQASVLPSPVGAIFSAPVVKMAREVPPIVRMALRTAACLYPRGSLKPGWFVTGSRMAPKVTRDEAWSTRQKTSSHYVPAFTFSALAAIGDLIDECQAFPPTIQCPSLVLAAGKDVYVKMHDVRDWFDKLASDQKSFLHYPDSYHVLWNDLGRESVIQDILAWIESRMLPA
ncbi:MAG: hypothetical protein Fur0032_24830 [Terrimicrobiaceae bacterium]